MHLAAQTCDEFSFARQGQGYNLMTPDKMHVANWLRSLPSSCDLITDYRPPSRLEVSKASLVLSLPLQNPIGPQASVQQLSTSFEKAKATDEEPPSFRSSGDQMFFPLATPAAPTPPNHLRSSLGNQANKVG
ncbi:unnamed protein product [Mesocestoides corti]|uniref:Uncharacterized protein n=2 Tax=Mesocestoides corti TaxID=53468 RepID=A0A0R3URD2_MESCO|nr:unnamed protein product [Mesocestoides corti]